MFTAALFTRVNIQKHPNCLTTDEWIQKKQYMYTMAYYLAIKKNESLPLMTTWMNLKGIMLSQISQTEKNKKQKISPKNKVVKKKKK